MLPRTDGNKMYTQPDGTKLPQITVDNFSKKPKSIKCMTQFLLSKRLTFVQDQLYKNNIYEDKGIYTYSFGLFIV